MFFLAKSIQGNECVYKRSTVLSVSKASAAEIAAALNFNEFKLNPGEIWGVHDGNADNNAYGKAYRRGGRVFVAEYFGFDR